MEIDKYYWTVCCRNNTNGCKDDPGGMSYQGNGFKVEMVLIIAFG